MFFNYAFLPSTWKRIKKIHLCKALDQLVFWSQTARTAGAVLGQRRYQEAGPPNSSGKTGQGDLGKKARKGNSYKQLLNKEDGAVELGRVVFGGVRWEQRKGMRWEAKDSERRWWAGMVWRGESKRHDLCWMVGRVSESLFLSCHQCLKYTQCFMLLMLVFIKEGELPLQPIYSVTLVVVVHVMDSSLQIIHRSVIVMLHERNCLL